MQSTVGPVPGVKQGLLPKNECGGRTWSGTETVYYTIQPGGRRKVTLGNLCFAVS